MTFRPVTIGLWSAAALMIAGIVHLASILILPSVATDDAFSRLSKVSGNAVLQALPKPASGQEIIPFRDPAIASAICRYDLNDGGLRIGAAMGDAAFLAISLHTRKGVPFYALTSRSGNEGRIDLLIVTPEQLEKIEAADNEDDPVHEVRVKAPDPLGFVEFDVLPRVGGLQSASEVLSLASCKLEQVH